MINSLLIKNFQSHENSWLEFHPGVNVIVGNSDSGKSAIIRALKWLIWNRPSGTEMMSNWCEKDDVTCVKVYITDFKHEHADRELWKGENKYHLHAQTFKAFGTSVPQELQDYFNINEINLQQQLDSPFLLSDTAGQVASHFNKVAKLDKIDTSTSNINSTIRKLTADIGYQEGQADTLKEELDKFVHLEKFEANVEVLEDMEGKRKQLANAKDKLDELISITTETIYNIEEESKLLQYETTINLIFKWREEKVKLEQDRKRLDGMIDGCEYLLSEIETQQDILCLEIPVNALIELYKDRTACVAVRKQLFNAVTYINSTNTKLGIANALEAKLQAEYEKAFPVGSICPLCNQKIR